ncbi:MAG: hypothetical protein ORN26_00190 [Candidatus Pacebacteria bacterium]|nr:hypothetical protein [Candidatus Paceibacterota bacterium]
MTNFILTRAGNVGIGNSSPQYPVDILGTSGDGSPTLRVVSTSTASAWNQTAHFMMPNIQGGGKNMIAFGKS